MNPTGKGGPKKGEVRNPNGRPRVPEVELVRQAIAETEIDKKKSLWKHLVEQAYEDNAVLIALTRKFVPDQITVESKTNLAEVLADAKKRIDGK